MYQLGERDVIEIVSEKAAKYINIRDSLCQQVDQKYPLVIREQLLEWTLRILKELDLSFEMKQNIILLADLVAMQEMGQVCPISSL